MSTTTSSNTLVYQGLVGYLDPSNPLSYLPEMSLIETNTSTITSSDLRSSGYQVSSPAYVTPSTPAVLRNYFKNIITGSDNQFGNISGDNYTFENGNMKVVNFDQNGSFPYDKTTNLIVPGNAVNTISIWVKFLDNFASSVDEVLYSSGFSSSQVSKSRITSATVFVDGVSKSNIEDDMKASSSWKNFTIVLNPASSQSIFDSHIFFSDKYRVSPVKSCLFGPILMYSRVLSNDEIKQNIRFFNSRFNISIMDQQLITSSTSTGKDNKKDKKPLLPIWAWILIAVVVVILGVSAELLYEKRKKNRPGMMMQGQWIDPKKTAHASAASALF